jgi:adenosine kinase
MSVCICGSLAYDMIMTFEGKFADHILPDKIHMLNLSFLVPNMKREFGGCAGNIAYGLKLLGGDPRPLATIGNDGAPYLERLKTLEIDDRGVKTVPESYTAQCFITTDLANNQLTAFHPGAMLASHTAPVQSTGAVKLGLIGPDGKDGTFAHARQMHAAGIPFVFDPGQMMPILTGDDLMELIGMADWLAVNDYEAELVVERTGHTLLQLSQQLRAVIVTKGEYGVDVVTEGKTQSISAVKAHAVVDPTGCGDAFRSGLLYGLDKEMDIVRAAQIGCIMGAIKIAHHGGQNYRTDWNEVSALLAQHYAH